MPFGFKEVEGIHSRTNFDLSQHEKYSGRSINMVGEIKMRIIDREEPKTIKFA